MTIPLLPCPFCGNKADIERFGNHGQSTIYTCESCGCTLETGEEWDHGKRWNERHPVVDVEALRRERDDAILKAAELEGILRARDSQLTEEIALSSKYIRLHALLAEKLEQLEGASKVAQ